MREVRIAGVVWAKIAELEAYLIDELELSEAAALRRSARMRQYVLSLANAADYSLCRFKKWRVLGYRCAVFEKDWIFAYETFEDGTIVRDMSHTSLLAE